METAVVAAVVEYRDECFRGCTCRLQRGPIDLHEDGRFGVGQEIAGSGEKLRFAAFNVELDEDTAGDLVKREKVIQAEEWDRGGAVQGDGGMAGMESAGSGSGGWHIEHGASGGIATRDVMNSGWSALERERLPDQSGEAGLRFDRDHETIGTDEPGGANGEGSVVGSNIDEGISGAQEGLQHTR